MSQIKVAITGGIGSGKSTVSRFIRDMGFPVFSCDEIYKEVIRSQEYINQIKNIFPEAVICGEIKRNVLSKIIFDDPKKRELLNNISHPIIMKKLLDVMSYSKSEIVFAEVPLLFEGNFEYLFDRIIVIIRKNEERVKAIAARDGIALDEIEKRIASQFDYFSAEGIARLNNCNATIIQNDGTFEELTLKIKAICSTM